MARVVDLQTDAVVVTETRRSNTYKRSKDSDFWWISHLLENNWFSQNACHGIFSVLGLNSSNHVIKFDKVHCKRYRQVFCGQVSVLPINQWVPANQNFRLDYSKSFEYSRVLSSGSILLEKLFPLLIDNSKRWLRASFDTFLAQNGPFWKRGIFLQIS